MHYAFPLFALLHCASTEPIKTISTSVVATTVDWEPSEHSLVQQYQNLLSSLINYGTLLSSNIWLKQPDLQ